VTRFFGPIRARVRGSLEALGFSGPKSELVSAVCSLVPISKSSLGDERLEPRVLVLQLLQERRGGREGDEP